MNKHIAIATSLGGTKSWIDIQMGLEGLRTLFKASLRLIHDDIPMISTSKFEVQILFDYKLNWHCAVQILNVLPKVNCGKILCSCNFPDGEGERKYLLGEIDRPLAAGFQAHVHPRDNIGTLGWRERGFLSGNIPGGRLYNQWNNISSTSDQLLFHSHTSNNLSSGFQAPSSRRQGSTLPWHFSSFATTGFNFASKVIVRNLAPTPFLLSLIELNFAS